MASKVQIGILLITGIAFIIFLFFIRRYCKQKEKAGWGKQKKAWEQQ